MVTRFTVSAASLIMRLPTSVDPVSEILRTTGEAINPGAIAEALPVSRLISPDGAPASWQHWISAIAEPGASIEGRQMTEPPAASAGAILRASSKTGKFQAVKAATTPTGRALT